ncbi:MAG TPA: glycosyltransferase 87 family protein [Xanthobacteraceae bacterium]
MKRITGLDWPLLMLAACLLAVTLAGAFAVTRVDDARAGVLLLVQSVPYAAAAWLVVRVRPESARGGRAVATILVVGFAMRCLLLPGMPVSTDIFRYVWDGRVQGAGINPYLHVPADAALAGLRDAAIYPHIDRADYAPTIYPPASQIVFYLVTRISEAPIAMKAAMLAFEALAVWTMLQLLAARGLPRSRILLYAWHPLPLWEFARSGHVDIVAIAFLLLALLASERRSPVLAGIALGAGALVKYFQAVTAPAVYRRWDWRLPFALLATIVVLYLPYIGAGTKVLGFLGTYMAEEGLDRGSGVFLWQLATAMLPLPQQAFAFYAAAAAALMAGLGLLVLLRDRRGADLAGAMLLAVTFTILLSPHYPWYFAWLVPFLCFYPLVGVVYLTCACGALYFAQWPPTVWDGLPIYLPCLFILMAELLFRRRRKPEEPHGDAVLA